MTEMTDSEICDMVDGLGFENAELKEKLKNVTNAVERLAEIVAELESQNVKYNYPDEFTSRSQVMQEVKEDIWGILNPKQITEQENKEQGNIEL